MLIARVFNRKLTKKFPTPIFSGSTLQHFSTIKALPKNYFARLLDEEENHYIV